MIIDIAEILINEKAEIYVFVKPSVVDFLSQIGYFEDPMQLAYKSEEYSTFVDTLVARYLYHVKQINYEQSLPVIEENKIQTILNDLKQLHNYAKTQVH